MSIEAKLLSALSTIETELTQIESIFVEAKEKVSKLDQIKIDIEHEIELNKLNAVEMTQIYKELQATLRLRRKYKDRIEQLLKFKEKINLTQVHKSKLDIKDITHKMNQRTYRHRVAYEIRSEILLEKEGL